MSDSLESLAEEDAQFSAIRELAKGIGCDDYESAAYAIERFSVEYYVNDETPKMSLSLAKKTFLSVGGQLTKEK